MGILRSLRLVDDAADVAAALELASPMHVTSDPGLSSIVWADWARNSTDMDQRVIPMTRAQAMAVPPVAAARHLVCPAIARMDLIAYKGDDALPTQPLWTSRTDSPVSAFHRMLWTVDDVLFRGWSLWHAQRGTDGFPTHLSRVPSERWRMDHGFVEVMDDDDAWQPMADSEAVLIPGPHEGILTFGAATIRQAADLLAAANQAARNPAAQVNLHYTGDAQLTPDEIQELVDWWVKARRGENGGVAFTSKNIEAEDMTPHDAHLMMEGRNAAAVDVARIIGIRAANIDATNAQASLTYETAETRGGELVTYGLSAYMSAITARLSLDDITPHGTTIRFDAEDQISPTGGNAA